MLREWTDLMCFRVRLTGSLCPSCGAHLFTLRGAGGQWQFRLCQVCGHYSRITPG